MAQQTKISFLLTGGIEEQQTEELKGPLVQQNGSPALTDSRNTRLSVEKGTCVRMPDVAAQGVSLGAGAPAHGIVSNARHKNYALYTTPDLGNRVVADDGYSPKGTDFIRDRLGERFQNAFVALHVSSAGAIANEREKRYPTYTNALGETHGIASSYNPVTNEHWVAWSVLDQGVTQVMTVWVASYDSDGTLLASPQALFYPKPNGVDPKRHVALTAHGQYGTRLWLTTTLPGSSPGVYYYELSTSGTKAVLGPAVIPIAGTLPFENMFAVTSDGAQYAYVASAATGGGINGVVSKVDVTAGTVTASATLTGAMAGPTPQMAISYAVVSGQPRVAALFAGASLVSGVYDQNLGVVLAEQTRVRSGDEGQAYVQFISCPRRGLVGAVFAYSFVDGEGGTPSVPAINLNFTEVWIRPFDGSADIVLYKLYGAVLMDHGVTWVVAPDEMYPLLFIAVNWGGIAHGLPEGQWEVLDQQIIGYTVGPAEWPASMVAPRAMLSPVARFGCVRGAMSPAHLAPPRKWFPAGSSLPRIGDDFYVPYKKADEDTPGRWVKLSVKPENPSTVQDRDGVAIVSGALPVQWDGAETFEFGGPLTAPQLNVVTGGSGSLGDGSYAATVIYEWRDAAGLAHRSMPSPTLHGTISPGGDHTLLFRTPVPLSMRYGDKHQRVRATLYMTRADGTSYHEIPFGPVPVNGLFEVSVSSQPDESWPIIYSRGLAGEELVPQPPPPLSDMAIVGTRLWGIDAEIPTRLVYSKHRISGIGFEFFPAGEVVVPSNAGDVLAVREMAGTVVAFAERGLFQISDGGPNNAGQGGSFGAPYRLSEVGCKSRLSVLSTPAGIIFLDHTGSFSMLSGGGVTQLPGAALSSSSAVTGAFLLEAAQEACFVVGSTVKVFNYALMRWTTWDLQASPTLVAGSAISRNIGLLYAQTTGLTYTVDSTTLHQTAVMRWETDWVLLGGDFQDYTVLYDVIFNAYSLSDHGIQLELFTNYDLASSTLRSWTASELSALKNVKNRYTVRVDPVRQDTRAVKLKVTEVGNAGTHQGCRPGALTILYSIDGLTFEESNLPGSHK